MDASKKPIYNALAFGKLKINFTSAFDRRVRTHDGWTPEMELRVNTDNDVYMTVPFTLKTYSIALHIFGVFI